MSHSPSPRLVFAGTPEFARVALEALLHAGFEVPLVLTQPDRPAGRGLKLQASPVKRWALAQGLEVQTPTRLRLDGPHASEALAVQAAIAQAGAQAMVVAAYGLLLPRWVLEAFAGPHQWGCLNIHASLLPRWRGAAPIVRAIEAGDVQTGISIMQMEEGLDTGPVRLAVPSPIGSAQTGGQLHDALASLGAQAIVRVLHQPEAYPAQVQNPVGVCYAHKLDKTQAVLDWTKPASVLARQIRAFAPQPGTRTSWRAERVKVLAAQVDCLGPREHTCAHAWQPGEIVWMDERGVGVQCGQGVLMLTQLQKAGGTPLSAYVLASRLSMRVGVTLGVNPQPTSENE